MKKKIIEKKIENGCEIEFLKTINNKFYCRKNGRHMQKVKEKFIESLSLTWEKFMIRGGIRVP